MKTPREILLTRHSCRVPELDRIRAQAIEMRCGGREMDSPKQPILSKAFSRLWSELILPQRGMWGGLAAIWILLLALNFGLRRERGTIPAPAPGMAGATEQQRQLLADLLRPHRVDPAEPPPKPVPQAFSPRSLPWRIS